MIHQAKAIGRREVLLGSAGTAALIALPQAASASAAHGRGLRQASGSLIAGQQVFVFGIPDPTTSLHTSVQALRPAGQGAVSPAISAAPISVATQLAALPAKSADGSTLALVSVQERPVMAVGLELVDTSSAAIVGGGTLALAHVPEDALVLVTPTLSADASVVALVLSVSIPHNWRTITKPGPGPGKSRSVRVATWVSHHEIAYFDRRGATFAGPFSLADGPSLARVSAIATATDLFLWTVEEAAAQVRPGTSKTAFKTGPAIRTTTQFSAFRFGEGKARFSVPAPGPWPVSGEPVDVLPSGEIVRLGYGRVAELYSPATGRATESAIPVLGVLSAKPGAPTMRALPDGTVFINSPAIGRAVIADPGRSFAVRSVVKYAPPAWPAGAPENKAVLSPDGTTLYVLGGAKAGGLSAYNVASNALVGSYSNGTQFAGLYPTANGSLLAVGLADPKLGFYAPSLAPLGSARTDLHVSAVF